MIPFTGGCASGAIPYVIFVDEAGQISLADVLAVSHAARSIVLLGDPQQLEQPVKGSHPDGAAVSALEHLLAGAISVWRPRSRTTDCALFDSSGRTKFSASVELTTFNPASIAAASSVAQYFPSKYSKTKTGTFAPTFTFRTKSLRTTLPAKTVTAFRSRSIVSICYIVMFISIGVNLASSAPVTLSSRCTDTLPFAAG